MAPGSLRTITRGEERHAGLFSARRLKGDQWDEFRKAWGEAATNTPEGCLRVRSSTTPRNIKDENEVISFGIFDVDRNSLDVVRGSAEDEAQAPGGHREVRPRHPARRGSMRSWRSFARSTPLLLI